MPYPPILRDINGDPLPQVWDKEIGNWRPVTGDDYGQRVRILGADGHPIDTDNPLYVSGSVSVKDSIDSLLYSLTSDRMIEKKAQFWGETVATANLATSIDISGASQVVVVLENKHDVAVEVSGMFLTRQARQAAGGGYVNAVYQESKTTSIPAGASVYLDKEIYATLGKIGVGLVLRIERDTAPTSGDLTMLVYGRRN